MAAIHSERLDLIPLTPDFLRAAAAGDTAQAGQMIGASIHADLTGSKDVFELRRRQIEDDARFQSWSLRAMVLRTGKTMIGHIGFHTLPGADYLKPYSSTGVEFGFTVFEPFRRNGYAREASLAMMNWAAQTHSIREFVLSIRPDNVASQRLAEQLGFVRVGSHIDDVDGLEEVLLLNQKQATRV